MSAKARHVVVSARGGWSVVRGGASRAARVFTTKRAAIAWGSEISRKEGAELYIHRSDGSIEDKRSYHKGKSFSEVNKEHLPLRPTGRDLADAVDRLAISEATLDAVVAAVEERRRDPARSVDL